MHNYQLKRRKGRDTWHIYWTERGEQKWASTGTADEALANTFLTTFKKLQQTQEYVNVGEILHQFTVRDYAPRAVSMSGTTPYSTSLSRFTIATRWITNPLRMLCSNGSKKGWQTCQR